MSHKQQLDKAKKQYPWTARQRRQMKDRRLARKQRRKSLKG